MISPEDVTKDRVLVDTDVFSYIFNNHTLAQYFRPYLLHRTVAVSFVTVAQMYFGAYNADWGPSRISRLEHYLKNYAILPYDNLICQRWAQIMNECKKSRHNIEANDIWIAACALRWDCALATNNRRHFECVKGLLLISPSLL